MFSYLTATECLNIASTNSAKYNIFNNIWHSAEFACVPGDNAAEAAEKALRVAESVSETHRVLFIDLQGSVRSFAERCRAKVTRNLLHVDVKLAGLDPSDPGNFLTELEETIVASGTRVCVIDSLFYLCEWYNKAGAARFFIMKLREMCGRLDVAILIGTNARKRVGKNIPGAEHLPKGTAPFVDAIVYLAPEHPEQVEPSELSELSELSEMSELSEPSEMFEPSEPSEMSESSLDPRPSTVRRKKRRR